MRARLRILVAASVLTLLFAGCGGSSDKAGPAGSVTSGAGASTSALAARPTLPKVAACTGLGPVPAAGEVTWLEHTAAADLVRSAHGCLTAVESSASTLQWAGAGDRVLAGPHVLADNGPVPAELTSQGLPHWSRPAGKSLFVVKDGRLLKQTIGEPVKDISFIDRTDLAIYHPSGRSIVAAGNLNGTDGVYIADNLGLNAQPLSTGEGSVKVSDAAFTASGALLFVAEHGDKVHVHRLEFSPAFKLSTIATYAPGQAPAHLTTSPFPGGGVAYDYTAASGCAGGRTLWISRGGQVRSTVGTAVEHGEPVGWLPDGTLVALVRPSACATGAGTLYTFKDGQATVVAKDAVAAAVRAPFPPPPPPPSNIPSQAPT